MRSGCGQIYTATIRGFPLLELFGKASILTLLFVSQIITNVFLILRNLTVILGPVPEFRNESRCNYFEDGKLFIIEFCMALTL